MYTVQPVMVTPGKAPLEIKPVRLSEEPSGVAIITFLLLIPISALFSELLHFHGAAAVSVRIGSCVIGAFGAGACQFFGLRAVRRRRAERQQGLRQAELERWSRERAITEAAELTKRLCGLLDTSYGAASELPTMLDSTHALIECARKEFAERGYAAFWDTVERADKLLSQASRRFRDVNDSARLYDELLRGRQHSFPPFPIDLDTLPRLNKTAEVVRLTMRLGHTDRDFEMTWQLRETRRVTLEALGAIEQGIGEGAERMADEYAEFGRTLADSLERVDTHVRETSRHTERVTELQEQLLRALRDRSA